MRAQLSLDAEQAQPPYSCRAGTRALAVIAASAAAGTADIGVCYVSEVTSANQGEAALGNSPGSYLPPIVTLSTAQIAKIKG